MPVIGNLAVRLSVNSNDFGAKMRGAADQTKKFGTAAASTSRSVERLGSIASTARIAVAGLATGAMAMFVRSQADAVIQADRVAERIGASTEEMLRMSYAAERTGSSADRMQETLTEMVQRLGEAKTGTGSAADGLKMIGLQAEKLVSLSPAAAFGEIADAINRLPTAADRVFAIDEIFGGDGREMINLLQLGSDGIARLSSEADAFGLAVSRADARKIREVDDAFKRVSFAIRGNIRQLTAEFAPKIIDVAEKSLVAIGYIQGAVETLGAGFYAVKGAVSYTFSAIIAIVDTAGRAIVSLLNLLPKVNIQWTDTLKQWSIELRNTGDEAFAKAGDMMASVARGDRVEAMRELHSELERTAGTLGKVGAAGDAAGASVADSMSKAGKAVQDALAKLRIDAADAGLSDMDRQLSALKRDGADDSQLGEARSLLNRIEQVAETQRIADAAEQSARRLSDTMGQLRINAADSGLGEVDKRLAALKRDGASTSEIGEATELLRKIEENSVFQNLQRDALEVIESIASPAEKLQKRLDRLAEMRKAGLLGDAEYDRAIAMERGGNRADESRRADMITAGSAEAIRARYDAIAGMQRMNAKDYGKEQVKEQKTTNARLKEIVDSARKQEKMDVFVGS